MAFCTTREGWRYIGTNAFGVYQQPHGPELTELTSRTNRINFTVHWLPRVFGRNTESAVWRGTNGAGSVHTGEPKQRLRANSVSRCYQATRHVHERKMAKALAGTHNRPPIAHFAPTNPAPASCAWSGLVNNPGPWRRNVLNQPGSAPDTPGKACKHRTQKGLGAVQWPCTAR